MSGGREFRLAAMSPFLLATTALGLLVPAFLVWTSLQAPVGMVRKPVSMAAVFIVVIYAGIWFYGRPRGFVVDAGTLTIVWPVRRREILTANITGAQVVDRDAFRQRFGRTFRVGAGGLWGQFGMAYGSAGAVDTYISTMGPWVLVDISGGRPLLLSPERPEEFVAALKRG